jgi:hypothetical protein
MPDDPLRYAPPQVRTPGTGRSPATWVKLYAVYALGLVSWVVYLTVIVYLLTKIL